MRFRRPVLSLLVLAAALSAASPARADRIMEEEFETYPWVEDGDNTPWADVRSDDFANTRLAAGFLGNGLHVVIPAGERRGVGPFYRFEGGGPDEAWFRYYIFLEKFNASFSGKLPGLSGIYGSSGKGCIPSVSGNPGWSARMYFLANGLDGAGPDELPVGQYVYHLDQPTDCGEAFDWEPGVLQPGRWHCIQGRVRINEIGSDDGGIQGWLDGERAVSLTGLRFRQAGERDIHIREFWLDVFFGGTEPTPNTLRLRVDEIVVSDSNRPACIDPFTDDNGSTHEADIVELHTRGFFLGCERRLACPERTLTRAEMAVLLARVLGLPKSDADHFGDDDDHWAEEMINRLADSGITLGCARRQFCPEDTVTRAELAVFLDRAYQPPAVPDADPFSDDDDHWASKSLERLAAVGVINGCANGLVCPDDAITRGQTAAFLARILRWVESQLPVEARGPVLTPEERTILTEEREP